MSKILYNVKRVVLRLIDETTGLVDSKVDPILVDTAEQVKLKPVTSKGEEKILRTEDRILASATQPDLTYGYDVELKDNKFSVEILSLFEGGTITYDSVDKTKIIGYDSPLMDQGNACKPFVTEIYVEEKKGASVVGYVEMDLNYCTGKAPEFEFKKGEFYSPTFSIDARENTLANKPIKSFKFLKTLPALTSGNTSSSPQSK